MIRTLSISADRVCKSMTAGAVVVLATLWALVSVEPAAAEEDGAAKFLKAFAGTWKGRGTVRRTVGAAAEPVSCRLDARFDGGALHLKMVYVYLGVDIKVETSGTVKYETKSARYSGSWHTVGLKSRAVGTGRRKGQTIRFALSGFHPETDEPMKSSFVLTLTAANKLASTLSAVDPQTGTAFKAFGVRFRR